MHILALLARGDTGAKVSKTMLKKYDLSVSERAISDYRKKHANVIDQMRSTMIEAQAIDADALMRRSRKLLNRKMDQAERDLSEIEKLDEEYREGKMKIAEYRRRRKGLVDLSVVELTQISKTAYDQTKTAPLPVAPEALTSGQTPSANAGPTPQLEQLLEALKTGNQVELQRIVFNPEAAK